MSIKSFYIVVVLEYNRKIDNRHIIVKNKRLKEKFVGKCQDMCKARSQKAFEEDKRLTMEAMYVESIE